MQQINETCMEVGASFRIVDYKSAFATAKESDIMQAAEKAYEQVYGTSPMMSKTSVCTGASVFHRLGVECLLFGAGVHEGNSYEPNEWVSIKKLQDSVQFYEKLINLHCGLQAKEVEK